MSVLTTKSLAGCYSDYDLDYIRWQIDRCPLTESFVCITPVQKQPQAAVVFWRHAQSSEFWRMAVFPQQGVTDQLNIALQAAIRYIYKQGGALVSMLLSRLQTDLLHALKAKGFIATQKRYPLYVFSRSQEPPAGELKSLSFLDTDLAYRFSMVMEDQTPLAAARLSDFA